MFRDGAAAYDPISKQVAVSRPYITGNPSILGSIELFDLVRDNAGNITGIGNQRTLVCFQNAWEQSQTLFFDPSGDLYYWLVSGICGQISVSLPRLIG